MELKNQSELNIYADLMGHPVLLFWTLAESGSGSNKTWDYKTYEGVVIPALNPDTESEDFPNLAIQDSESAPLKSGFATSLISTVNVMNIRHPHVEGR